jgi:hypothetical protein
MTTAGRSTSTGPHDDSTACRFHAELNLMTSHRPPPAGCGLARGSGAWPGRCPMHGACDWAVPSLRYSGVSQRPSVATVPRALAAINSSAAWRNNNNQHSQRNHNNPRTPLSHLPARHTNHHSCISIAIAALHSSTGSASSARPSPASLSRLACQP